MNTLSYKKSGDILRGRQIYRKNEYSFDFVPESQDDLRELIGNLGSTSLSLGTLQIEVSIQSKRLLYVWGYHPWFKWEKYKLPDIHFFDGIVFFSSTVKIEQGVSLDIDVDANWRTLYDTESGWIVASDGVSVIGESFIRIADGCVVGLGEGKIHSVCINPVWSEPWKDKFSQSVQSEN